MRIPVAPHPCQHLVLLVFNFSLPDEYEVISHHGFNLHFVSLMTNDIRHFFICLLAIWITYFVKHLIDF